MNEMTMLFTVNPIDALDNLFVKKIPLAISYLSDGIWTASRGFITEVNASSFLVMVTPQLKTRDCQINADMNLGVSFQYGYGSGYDKFIFNTVVLDSVKAGQDQSQRLLKLAVPENIEMVPRRNFQRVMVPESLDIDVCFWQRYKVSEHNDIAVGIGPSLHAKLIDISARGLQIVLKSSSNISGFEKGNILGLRFTPSPNETPLSFDTIIRTILPTADQEHFTLGLEIVGLEASPEGRLVLSRIGGIVKQYQNFNSKK